jgi:hypothetical protein
MWGSLQEGWVMAKLTMGLMPTWIINGSQFFGLYGPSESLETDFPNHFGRFMVFLQGLSRQVTFVSGDIHASEIIRVPKEFVDQDTLEITSSSMHAIHSPVGSLKPSPRRVAGFDGDNFVIVTIKTLDNDNSMLIESFDAKHRRVFQLLRSEFFDRFTNPPIYR